MFLFHWQEESQQAILDEMEWMSEDRRISAAEREREVSELIGLVGAVDGIVQMQAKADAGYFVWVAGSAFDDRQQQAIGAMLLSAYRWKTIASGVQDPRFLGIIGSMIDADGARASKLRWCRSSARCTEPPGHGP